MKGLSWSTRLYIVAVLISTAALILWQWFRFPLYLDTPARLSAFIGGVLLVTLANLRPIKLPRTAHLSLGSVFGLSAICLFDSTFGTVVFLIGLILAYGYIQWKHRKVVQWKWYQIAFSIAAQTLSLDLGGELYLMLHQGSVNPIVSLRNALLFILGGLVFVLLNSILIGVVIGLAERVNPLQVMLMNGQGSLLQFVANVPLSGIVIVLYESRPWAVLLILLPLYAIHLSFEESAILRDHTQDTLQFVARLVDAREPFTARHSRQVARYAAVIAREAQLPLRLQEKIQLAATLHDLGKLSVPETILLKPGELEPSEWIFVHTHPDVGASLVEKLAFLRETQEIVRCHHERFDGTGYPVGIAGEEIPLGARILAVADALDAITVDRPYRQAMTWEAALSEIEANAGTQFDPEVVEVALRAHSRLEEIFRNEHNSLPDA
jgi:putative nucleotidyltransferase with HDIG domain